MAAQNFDDLVELVTERQIERTRFRQECSDFLNALFGEFFLRNAFELGSYWFNSNKSPEDVIEVKGTESNDRVRAYVGIRICGLLIRLHVVLETTTVPGFNFNIGINDKIRMNVKSPTAAQTDEFYSKLMNHIEELLVERS